MINPPPLQKKLVFLSLLFKKTLLPITTISVVSLVYILLMSMIDHSYPLFLVIIPALAIIKTYIIFNTTFKQLSSLMLKCHSVQRLLWVFGTLITVSIFSFATDYTCLYQYDNSAFAVTNKLSPSFISDFYNFFYFSLITFSTVGYGDITPVSNIAKFIIMLEIGLSFLIVVFAIANIKKAHLNV